MPRYKKEINRLITIEQAKAMIEKAENKEHKFLIAMLYITGARPLELLKLKKRDFETKDSDLRILLPTKKRKRTAGGMTLRMLPFDIKQTPFVSDIIVPWISALGDPDTNALTITSTTRIQQIVYTLSDNEFCPYNFRHNRLSQIALNGGTIEELKQFKGATNIASITPYLFMSPAVLERLKKHIR